MLTVHLRINDAATGQPTPVRVRVSGPDGAQYAPLGRSAEFPTRRNEAVGGCVALAGGERWLYIDGACEIALPAGVPIRVQAAKGPEYTPLDETVTLGAGQISLRFAVELADRRWPDTRTDGWAAIDTRCHFLTAHDAILEAAAEGLDVVNVLATPQLFPSLDGIAYPTVPNLLAFSGQAPALERDGRAVVVNTFNTHPVLGKVALLHSHRPVFPLAFGGEETDDWGVCDWCDQCHRKGGLTVWVDPFEPAGGLVGGESLVAAVLGKIDAIEVSPGVRKVPLLPWVYRLWNAGFLVPLVGGSGKDSNKVALGAVRTYALSMHGETWVDGVRKGLSLATAGPFADITGGDGWCFASLRHPGSATGVELVANGEVIAEERATSIAGAAFAGPGWAAARCPLTGVFAHTSPMAVGGPARDPEAVGALVKLIEQTREWAERHGRYTNPKRREQLLTRCAEAIAKLTTA
jgi:hypothetical protein